MRSASSRALAVLAVVGTTGLAGAVPPSQGVPPGQAKKVAVRKAERQRDPVALDWKRDPRARSGQGESAAPAAPEMPSELQVTVAVRVEASRVPAPAPADPLADRAIRAGDEVAREAAREWGYRQYWRAGFGRGLDQAMDDDRLGSWDRAEGFRYGHLDPRALMTGQQIAQESAEDQAADAAADRVREQFSDLTRMPRRDARPAVRASVPSWSGTFAIVPVLADVFTTFPLSSAPGLSRDGRVAMEGWEVQPADLARDGRGGSVYDAAWKDADRAFVVWRERQRPGSYWSRYGSADRERFRGIFTARFTDTLASMDLRPTYVGWRIGFEDGWRYGAGVRAEWAYRQGYAEGFDAGVRDAAAIAWPFAFDRAYAASYDAAFGDWSRNPHPDFAGVRLSDENDDGVFEPGERVFVEADVVNYGGAGGRFELTASGDGVDGTASTTVEFAGRGRGNAGRALALRIDDRTRPRTQTAVAVALGDARLDAPLLVSRPLEIDGEPLVEADRLAGRVTVSFAVVNRSRREQAGLVRVETLTGGRGTDDDELGKIPAGASRRATATFDGLRPLDLIGGTAAWRATVLRGSGIDDERQVGIASSATDLDNPDLLDFMIALAREPRADRNDVYGARSLLMDRLRADWARAAAADGNPYKRDFESAGTETALGELVHALHGRRSFASPQVFDGLDGDIAALAGDLPGAHPLLRKWMTKLAKRVG